MVRASVYLERDIWERAKAVTSATGVVSVSQVINDFLLGIVPVMEGALERAKKGDRAELLQFMDTFLAGQIGTLGEETAALRRELTKEPEKGAEA